MDESGLRSQAVAKTVTRVKEILNGCPLDRAALEQVLEEVKGLAMQPQLWTESRFPAPAEDEMQARYLISGEPDQSLTLYLNIMRPGKRTLPHNHTTWACIAGVEGVEQNYLYERTDDASAPGVGTLEQRQLVAVGPGTGIALMPDDIHAVHIDGSRPIRHLHMYGRALETLSERIAFDLDTGRYERMPIGVKTRK